MESSDTNNLHSEIRKQLFNDVQAGVNEHGVFYTFIDIDSQLNLVDEDGVTDEVLVESFVDAVVDAMVWSTTALKRIKKMS